MSDETIERAFPVNGKAVLKLSNISGSIRVLAGDPGQIAVSATKRSDRGDASRTEIEMSQDSDGRVNVATRFPEGILSFLTFSHPCDVDYVVHIPRTCQAKISGVSCLVEAEGLEGDLEFSTVSGELELKDIQGNVKASTVSGELEGDEIKGNLRLKSVSGELSILHAEATQVEASTVSGGIRMQTTLGEGPYRFHTVSGEVRLELPADAAFKAEHQSVSGGIQASFPVAHRSKNGGNQFVEVGSGGPKITSNSISGCLYIVGPEGEAQPVRPAQPEKPAMPEAPVPPEPPAVSLSPEERREILERIERGEISVEDGIQALQGH
jgi:hypothetical protein